ncbi:DUF533 domain-containing protein [Ancylobacter sp. 6x-1]|uniref:DUF533 domain-containing protein n=1 Tax=Ancylobacter crimeensis TaxID=2579147 RepID=A0ABT0DEI7_9HYPH|nr:DUF533 domain-containing protein [Ancylobacter crimeensis]MCK0198365.1 DUF533 domain-containing protein [Ancylobacter crimeensis]
MFDTRNIDARKLLDQFLTAARTGTGATPTTANSGSGGLGDLLKGGLGGLLGSTGGAGGGAGGSIGGGVGGGLATGALISLVLGSKKGRALAGKAATLGGLALVGTLAYRAWQNHQAGQPPAEAQARAASEAAPALPPRDSVFHPEAAAAGEMPLTLLRTMIAAALADGHVDEAERTAIGARLAESRLAGADNAAAFLAHELASPASVEDIARSVARPEEAVEVYLCALLAIDPDSSAERAFLARLALALRLDPALVPHLEAAARSAHAD